MSAWAYLMLAGVLEIGFASMIKLTGNFTRVVPTILLIVFVSGSFYSLTKAVETIPLGTAYAIWTGIGALGTIVVGVIFYNEPTDFLRLFFIITLIASIIGLKLVSAQ